MATFTDIDDLGGFGQIDVDLGDFGTFGPDDVIGGGGAAPPPPDVNATPTPTVAIASAGQTAGPGFVTKARDKANELGGIALEAFKKCNDPNSELTKKENALCRSLEGALILGSLSPIGRIGRLILGGVAARARSTAGTRRAAEKARAKKELEKQAESQEMSGQIPRQSRKDVDRAVRGILRDKMRSRFPAKREGPAARTTPPIRLPAPTPASAPARSPIKVTVKKGTRPRPFSRLPQWVLWGVPAIAAISTVARQNQRAQVGRITRLSDLAPTASPNAFAQPNINFGQRTRTRTKTRECREREIGKCREGFFRETRGGTRFITWRKRNC